MAQTEIDFELPEEIAFKGYRPRYQPSMNQVIVAAQAINQARKPILYVGGGAITIG